jgi:hypothetical protein
MKKMKKFISILFVLFIVVSCTEQAYYEIPLDDNGNILLTGVSSTEGTGISTLDDGFTITATFATAKSGDVMMVELLQLQTPPEGGASKQMLPMAGTQQNVTVGSDLKGTVSYSRSEANLNDPGDNVRVVYNGATDYAKATVEMVPAAESTKPMVSGIEIDVARTPEIAYFNVIVEPKAGAYTGGLVAERKNGGSASWEAVPGSPFTGAQPFLVPISGDDFAVGKDTMDYRFVSVSGSYTDEIAQTIIVRDPYFFLKKQSGLVLGGASAGRNLLINEAVAEDDPMAMVSIADSLSLKGGSAYLAAGYTIEFVPTNVVMYELNNSTDAKEAFNAGTPTTSANPIDGKGYFIYKAVMGAEPKDTYFGMMKMTNVVPNSSVQFEYRIGDKYAQLGSIE